MAAAELAELAEEELPPAVRIIERRVIIARVMPLLLRLYRYRGRHGTSRCSIHSTDERSTERGPRTGQESSKEGFGAGEQAARTGGSGGGGGFKYENTFAAQLEKALNKEFAEEGDGGGGGGTSGSGAGAGGGGHGGGHGGGGGDARMRSRERGVSGRSFNQTAGLEGARLEQVARFKGGSGGGSLHGQAIGGGGASSASAADSEWVFDVRC